MAAGDGDGWSECDFGHRHWGRHNAAGLLAVHHDADGTPHVLLQKRAEWSHEGGTWALPGGALDSHEGVVQGALREAREEAGLDPGDLRIQGLYRDDHGGWSFTTVIAEAAGMLEATPTNAESTDLRWFTPGQVPAGDLHPGFATAWPVLSRALAPLTVILDVANIVGARAEHGWWRDRAGAATGLASEVAELAARGVRDVPPPPSRLDGWFPYVTMVVEGAARGIASVPGVTIVAAPGSGDDAIVRAVRDVSRPHRVLVVTADRGLRERVTAEGALVTGPRWLLSQL